MLSTFSLPPSGPGRCLLGYALLGVGLFFLSGCGLAEYEAKMEAQQKRLAYITEEGRLLAEVGIFWPKPKDSDKEGLQPDQIFFRPPKGVNTTSDDKKPAILHTFAASGSGPFKEVLVGGRVSPNSEKFIQEVLTFLKITSKERKPKVVGPASDRVNFECFSEKKKPPVQPTNIDVCFHKAGDINIAIAFRWDDPKESTVEPIINFSLGSLRAGPATRTARIFVAPGAKGKKAK